jgi:hypothetical protein
MRDCATRRIKEKKNLPLRKPKVSSGTAAGRRQIVQVHRREHSSIPEPRDGICGQCGVPFDSTGRQRASPSRLSFNGFGRCRMESNLSKRRFRWKKSHETVMALVLIRKPLLPFQLIA